MAAVDKLGPGRVQQLERAAREAADASHIARERTAERDQLIVEAVARGCTFAEVAEVVELPEAAIGPILFRRR